MTAQLALDLSPLTLPDYEPELTIAERFALFHAANPQVADLLEHLAREWFAAGHAKVGVKALAERARWESGLSTSGSLWKINNSFVSHYARLLIERNPQWADRINLRELRAA